MTTSNAIKNSLLLIISGACLGIAIYRMCNSSANPKTVSNTYPKIVTQTATDGLNPNTNTTVNTNKTPVTSAPKLTPEQRALLAQGRKIYMSWCASCHGKLGDGNSPVAGTLNPKPTNFTTGFVHNNTGLPDTQYAMQVLDKGIDGTAMVPMTVAIPNLQDRQAVVAYILSLR
jgi:mono/diheme cytochrome c family protein